MKRKVSQKSLDGFVNVEKKQKVDSDEPKVVIDDGKCKVIYIENFLNVREVEDYILHVSKHPYKKDEIVFKQSTVAVPRGVFLFSDDGLFYSYAGKPVTGQIWPEYLEDLRGRIHKKCLEFGEDPSFNFVIAAKYENDREHIGPHGGNVNELVDNGLVSLVTLGVTRRFYLEGKKDKKRKYVTLKGGSLLLMMGETQKHYKYATPKATSKCAVTYTLLFNQVATKNDPLQEK